MEISKKIKEELKDLPENWIVLILTDAEKYLQVNTEVLKMLLSQDLKGIYITINKPYKSMVEFFKKKGLPVEKLYFVDCVTEMIGGETKREESVIYIHPTNLTGISIAVNELIQKIEGDKFLFIDSLTTLLIYNSTGSTEKFSHFMTNRIRLYNLKGLLLSLEEEMKEKLLPTLSKFTDKVIKI